MEIASRVPSSFTREQPTEEPVLIFGPYQGSYFKARKIGKWACLILAQRLK